MPPFPSTSSISLPFPHRNAFERSYPPPSPPPSPKDLPAARLLPPLFFRLHPPQCRESSAGPVSSVCQWPRKRAVRPRPDTERRERVSPLKRTFFPFETFDTRFRSIDNRATGVVVREFSRRIDVFSIKSLTRRCWSTLLEISHEWIRWVFLYVYIYVLVIRTDTNIYIYIFLLRVTNDKVYKVIVESCFLRRKEGNLKDEAIDQQNFRHYLRIFNSYLRISHWDRPHSGISDQCRLQWLHFCVSSNKFE